MHSAIEVTAELPDVPWATKDGISFRELGNRCEALLDDVSAGFPGADDVGLALLAENIADLRHVLRDLSCTQLAVNAIYDAGAASRSSRPPRHLRLA